MSAGADVRRLTGMMRQALVVSVVILLALGIDLLLFPGSTDRFFSWPIQPPYTASVFAANYLAATVVLALAMRGRVWAPVRTVLPGGIAFSSLAVVATLLHFGKFNQHSDALFAQVITWVWLVAYAVLPPVLIIAWPGQVRAPGHDPGREPPPAWLRTSVGATGAVMLFAGVGLFLVPDQLAKVWPWFITPLTGRVLGAWACGLGLVFGLAAVENDRMRLRAPVAALGLFGVLQALAIVRDGSGEIDWGSPGAWAWAALLIASAVLGAAGWAVIGDREPRWGAMGA